MAEYDDGFFQWSIEKAAANIQKHGISFNDASRVFEDPTVLEMQDQEHSWDEDRWIALGRIPEIGIVSVVWVSRNERVRLISARPATSSEGRSYERHRKS